MNRLSPWIVRKPELRAPQRRATAMAAMPWTDETQLGSDLRMFLTVYVGGLVFFGTLFG